MSRFTRWLIWVSIAVLCILIADMACAESQYPTKLEAALNEKNIVPIEQSVNMGDVGSPINGEVSVYTIILSYLNQGRPPIKGLTIYLYHEGDAITPMRFDSTYVDFEDIPLLSNAVKTIYDLANSWKSASRDIEVTYITKDGLKIWFRQNGINQFIEISSKKTQLTLCQMQTIGDLYFLQEYIDKAFASLKTE